MGKRKQYTEAFKKDAVRLMLARGTQTVEEVAQRIGVGSSMLHRWHQKYGAELSGSAVPGHRARQPGRPAHPVEELHWPACAWGSCSRKSRCSRACARSQAATPSIASPSSPPRPPPPRRR